MKENFYYIDEAGGLSDDSGFFILGCYKTDTPEEIRLELQKLKESILNSPYFSAQRSKFIKDGFHATNNHPDIWSRYYNLLATLNIRAYILVLKKESDLFKSFLAKKYTSDDIYNLCIKKLLSDRLTKTRNESNTIIFEEYGSKPPKWLSNVNEVLAETVNNINHKFESNIAYTVEVRSKSDLNLSIIDYINYLFFQLFEGSKMRERMLQNFTILEPKIALIYKMDKDQYFDNTKRININEY